ncbi:hypothetical protein V8P79_08560 [Acinetobacter baumannii]
MKYLNNFKTPLPCDWLEIATTCRKDTVKELAKLEKDLSDCYSLYDSYIKKFNTKPASSKLLGHKDLLISYYNEAPSNLNEKLINRRNNHELYFCPYCGDPKTPDTLDHFMPKDLWPEFAFFPNNLIPQCRGCAPIKGSKYYCDINNISKFIHPIYFNSLDKIRFSIEVKFNTTDLKTDFLVKYKVIGKISLSEKKRLIMHIKKLKINQRINDFCIKEYNFWKNKLLLNKFDIEQALLQRISEIPEKELARDWKSALYEGMLKNEDLINYLKSLKSKKKKQTVLNDFDTITIDDFNE